MEIRDIENIEPKEILVWFKKICSIPHGSYHEEAISKWLAQTVRELGCEIKVYPSGMILARQKASKGCEKWPVTLIQSHMDMVLAKTDKCEYDLLKDPIIPIYDTESNSIRADHTSLGADNGIGIAISLAIMSNNKLVHGPLEYLFTVNEEDKPGECVRNELKLGELTAKYYLNVDSEELNITYGGSGCSTMKYEQALEMEKPKAATAYRISLTGLKGGHSGVNINRPHINPIEFLAQVVYDCAHLNQHPLSVCGFEGGPINNSLPTYAKIDVVVDPEHFERIKRFAISQLLIAKKVAQGCEPEAVLAFDKIEVPKKTCSLQQTKNILLFASLAPNKIFTPLVNSTTMFSSSNLGFISIKNEKLFIDFKVRSFIDAEVQRNVRKIASLGKALGFTKYIQHGLVFSFMSNVESNELAKQYAIACKKITGIEPTKYAVPGGLECSDVCLKNPNMTSNAISVGATISNCHSPSESVYVPDLINFWEIIKLLLTKLNK